MCARSASSTFSTFSHCLSLSWLMYFAAVVGRSFASSFKALCKYVRLEQHSESLRTLNTYTFPARILILNFSQSTSNPSAEMFSIFCSCAFGHFFSGTLFFFSPRFCCMVSRLRSLTTILGSVCHPPVRTYCPCTTLSALIQNGNGQHKMRSDPDRHTHTHTSE